MHTFPLSLADGCIFYNGLIVCIFKGTPNDPNFAILVSHKYKAETEQCLIHICNTSPSSCSWLYGHRMSSSEYHSHPLNIIALVSTFGSTDYVTQFYLGPERMRVASMCIIARHETCKVQTGVCRFTAELWLSILYGEFSSPGSVARNIQCEITDINTY